jgi:ABC-type nitrate/sulfonate/bicarbonate transport system substrate-binding protein
MWPPVVADQLFRRGYDVHAVAARKDLRTRVDAVIFLTAQSEERAIVTENVAHFLYLTRDAVQRGGFHWGLILTPTSFGRRHPDSLGRLVRALQALIDEGPDQRNLERWLR